MQIMPGGGIHSENVIAFKEEGFGMVHFSATKKKTHSVIYGGLFQKKVIGNSDPNEIERIIKLLS